MPPVLSLFPKVTPSAGAESLIQAVTPDGPQPIVVVQRYGQGKVAALFTDSLWRWRLSMQESKPYQRFWDQLLTWLSPSEEAVSTQLLELMVNRSQVYLGEQVLLSARFGEESATQETAVVECKIRTPDDRVVPFKMEKQAVVTATGKSFPGFGLPFAAQAPGLYLAGGFRPTGAQIPGRTSGGGHHGLLLHLERDHAIVRCANLAFHNRGFCVALSPETRAQEHLLAEIDLRHVG